MAFRIALVTEIMAAVICLYCIYGRKFVLNIKPISLTLGVLIILEIINFLQLGGMFSFCAYALLVIYCKFEFKCSFTEALISFVMCMVVLTTVQFLSFFFVGMIKNEYVRNAVSNTLVLLVILVIFPRCGLHKLQKSICSRHRFCVLLLGFVCAVIILMLLQGKIHNAVNATYFVLVIPAIVLLLYSIIKWYTAQVENERMQEEICEVSRNVGSYEELLTSVRLRQHEFKNHLAAIFATHYTHKTYEKLVKVQEEYCNKLTQENKYNRLLSFEDNVLAGYLYGKFQEIEAEGIELRYQVNAQLVDCRIPTYYVIEMLGILLDNAVEALKGSNDKQIVFEILESEKEYQFVLKNPYKYIPYEEILRWFQLETSGKGIGRGLGLYHLKCLCEEWKCDIECKNIELNERNWITFILKIRKEGSK